MPNQPAGGAPLPGEAPGVDPFDLSDEEPSGEEQPLETLEIVVGGEVVAQQKNDDRSSELQLRSVITANRSSWVAASVFEAEVFLVAVGGRKRSMRITGGWCLAHILRASAAQQAWST